VHIVSARIRAALVYLAASAIVATVVFTAVFFLWYPGPFFAAAGGLDLLKVMVGVDVTLGPLVVLVIYKPGKWGLKFDLVTLAILQLCALMYGVYVLFEARPAYIAFVKDRFEIARANGFPEGELAKGGPYASLPLTGPRWVGVKLPTDQDEAFKLLVSGMGGVDAQYYPKYYVSFESVKKDVATHAQPIDLLRKRNPGDGERIDEAVAKSGKPEASIGFVPIRAGKSDLSAIVDRATGAVLRVSSVRPWGDI
jgi:hypothetical protein